MNDLRFEEKLKRAGDFKLDVSERVDNTIVNMIRGYEPSRNNIFSVMFYRIAFSIVIFAIVVGVGINIQRKFEIINQTNLYNRIIGEIIKANNTKDLNAALNLYSKEFFILHDKNKIRNNINEVFKLYKEIAYKPKMEKIVVRKNKMMIKSEFTYTARNDKQVINYNGKERIYLKKENNKWKIIAWIYEK